MSRAVWTDTADYMILRCAACGMPHIVHRQMMRAGISCRDCGAGPLIPEGYAIMIDVSIHVPTRGTTMSQKSQRMTILCFNPRSHKGNDVTSGNSY